MKLNNNKRLKSIKNDLDTIKANTDKINKQLVSLETKINKIDPNTISQKDIKKRLDLLDMKWGNFIYNLDDTINRYIQRWPSLFNLLSRFIIIFFILVFIAYNYFHPISDLATWSGSFGSIFAVLVALHLNKKQPKMKIGSDVLVSEDYVIASFLNRRQSEGFIKAEKLYLCVKDNHKYIIIREIPKYDHQLFSSEWQRYHSVSSTKPFELFLYNNKKDDNKLQNIYDYCSKLGPNGFMVDKYFNNPMSSCFIGIEFVCNDYSPNITIYIKVNELTHYKVINDHEHKDNLDDILEQVQSR